MCNIADFETFNHLAEVSNAPQDTVVVTALHLNPDTAGAQYGLVFSGEQGYDTVLWVGNHTLRHHRVSHVWYEATFDNDGDLVAISTFVRSEALDSRMSALRTLVSNVKALTSMAHLRFDACGRKAGSYTVSGCHRPIVELIDILEV